MKFISDITVGRSMTIETLNTCRQKISTDIKIKILNFFSEQPPQTYSGSTVIDIFEHKNTHIPFRSYTANNYFLWNDYHIYYFEHYDLKLTDDFIKYVLSLNKND